MSLLAVSTSLPLGLDIPACDARFFARGTFLRGQPAAVDFRGQQSSTRVPGSTRSHSAVLIPPSVQGSQGGAVHAVTLDDLDPNEKCKARLCGRVTMRLTSVQPGDFVTLFGNSADQRIWGIVLTADVGGEAEVLWDGVRGFGQIVDVSTPTNDPPVADLTATPSDGTAPLTVALDAAGSTDADGSIVKYEFRADDGTAWVDNGTDPTLDVLYQVGGVYNPAVRVTDDDGAQDIATVRVEVTNPTTGMPDFGSGSGDGMEDDPGDTGQGSDAGGVN